MASRKRPQPPLASDAENRFARAPVPDENVVDLKALLKARAAHAQAPSSRHGRFPWLFARRDRHSDEERTPAVPSARPPARPQIVVSGRRVRAALRFALVGFVAALPVFAFAAYRQLAATQGSVLGTSTEAYGYLQSGGAAAAAFDFREAEQLFAAAEGAIAHAQGELSAVPPPLLGVVRALPAFGERLKSGEHLLRAGALLASAGKLVSGQLAPLEKTALSLERDARSPATPLAELLATLSGTLDALKAQLTATRDELALVRLDAVPEGQRAAIATLQSRLPQLLAALDQSRQMAALLTGMTGGAEARDYLLVFQNNREIRATGGFLGSLALVEATKGEIRILEVPSRGPYEINDDFSRIIVPPQPLRLINDRWQLQDANWWPDWPTSAAKIIWFYEQARGFPLHGVISMTPTLVEDVLRATGPVDFTERYGVVLTAENFVAETQREVEADYDRQVNRPKQLIADLLPVLLDRLLTVDPDRVAATLTVLARGLEEKHLLFFFTDPALQGIVTAMGWDGALRPAPMDSLNVVHTNISGGKTDGAIEELVEYRLDPDATGGLTATVRITRTHHGDRANRQENVRNLDYVRVYAPEGSVLLDALGFSAIDRSLLKGPPPDAQEDADLKRLEAKPVIDEATQTRIWNEFGKTVFANWIQTNVGATQTVTLRYRLPFRLSGDRFLYTLMVGKQPGHPGQKFRAVFPVPRGWRVENTAPQEAVTKADGVLAFESQLSRDQVFGFVLTAR